MDVYKEQLSYEHKSIYYWNADSKPFYVYG